MSRSAVIWALTILLSAATARAEQFDSSAFKNEEASAAAKAKTNIAASRGASGISDDESGALDLEKIKTRMEAFNTLIANEGDQVQKSKNILARAGLFMQRARSNRKTVVKGVSQAEVVKDFERAFSESDKIAKSKGLPRSLRAIAYYIAGASLSEMEQTKEASQYLRSSLEMDPKSQYAEGITLYVAEDYFEREKYKEAIDSYQKYLKFPNPPQVVHAKYKIAWCHINLGRYAEAERHLTELIKNSKEDPLARESIRDLAFVSVKLRTEQQTISYSKEVFGGDDKARVEFLSSAYINYQRRVSQGGSQAQNSAPKIFAELLSLVQDPAKRVQLWLEALRNARRSYITRPHIAAFENMRGDLASIGEDKVSKAMSSLGADLDSEIQALVFLFAETYAGRTTNREKIPRAEIGSNLQEIFRFYEKYFPNAPKRQAMYRLWMDVCADLKDSSCVYRVSKKIQGDSGLKDLHEDASVEQIAALEKLSQNGDEGTKFKGELIATLEKMAARQDFKRWADVANRLSGIYVSSGDHDKAIRLLEEVYRRKPDEASLYRLQGVRFQTEKYAEVVAQQDPYKTARLQTLVRESSLKLAIQSQDKGDFPTYESHIDRFLKSKPDAKKELLVLHDHLLYTMDRAGLVRAATELAKLPAAKRFSSDLREVTLKIAVALMLKGDFKFADEVLQAPNPTPGRKELLYESVLARLGNGTKVDSTEIDMLEQNRREHVLGVLSFSQPEKVLLYVKTLKRPAENIKRIAYLSAQIQQGKIEPELDSSLRRIVGNLAPASQRALTQSETMAAGLRMPSTKLDALAYARHLKSTLDKVRRIRTQAAKDLKGQQPGVQVRILRNAAELELKAAAAVKASPLPDNLPKDKHAAYRTGLAQISTEFTAQANAFRNAEKTSIAAVSDSSGGRTPASENSAQAAKMPTPRVNSWFWPSHPSRSKLFHFIREKKMTPALIMLDLQREDGVLSTDDYYAFRSGTLLASSLSPAMIDYVYRELRESGQDALIMKWKRQ